MTGALGLTLAAFVLALAACGDDDGSSAATAPPDPVPTDPAPSDRTDPTDLAPTDPAPTETEVSVTIEPQSPKPPPPPTLPGATNPAVPAETSGPPGTGPPQGVDDAASAAIEDLAGRIGVDRSAITVDTDERVTWRDGSLGCPQPGMAYTQALVPGRRLVLAGGGRTYAYHGTRTGPLTYCVMPHPNGTAPGDTGSDD
ncbi:MAG: hypothetical protein M3337_08705 [Actinomycetota bacterium]|nr:hypothetical protein [Actinomycetota bacterium]